MEPLKNMYNEAFIDKISTLISEVYAEFNYENFKKSVFNDNYNNLELKERMRHISTTLGKYLPSDYAEALKILMQLNINDTDFTYIIFSDFVEVYGLDNYQLSIPALEHFTKWCSSEFAVRPFIIKYEDQMMAQMLEWTKSENTHVRRLASEGCRPRLPWAIALPKFKKDPSKILPILEALKNDKEEYVRKSVANNLNDISKDNPEIAGSLISTWYGHNKNLDRIVKHGSRTLLKAGNTDIMKIFAYHNPDCIEITNVHFNNEVPFSGELEFSFDIISNDGNIGKLRIEYIIEYVRLKGKSSKKVFKIAEGDYPVTMKSVKKLHSFKPVTTRKYYPGTHGFYIIINGVQKFSGNFELLKEK